MLNEQNGSILYWPVTLKEKYEWYRYFARKDPYVSQAIDLHTELPLSKIILKMPEMKDQKKREFIRKKYEEMCKTIKLFEKLQQILREYFIIGNCFAFLEWNEDKLSWDRMVILPPEEVNVTRYEMNDHSCIEFRPEETLRLMERIKGIIPETGVNNMEELLSFIVDEGEKNFVSKIPFEIANHLLTHDAVRMDTDPYTGDGKSGVGSYVYHMARAKAPYYDLGVSMLERVMEPLLLKFQLTCTQLSLATRNMTPRNKICTDDGVTPEQLEDLRAQVDMTMMFPDYAIVTNYNWTWEQIGSQDRLLDLQKEYEYIENQLFAGLGITRELVTGESQYSGGKINIEVLNTRYLILRETLQNMIEENIFLPMAKANGFYEKDEHGFITYFYPRVSFSRLSIRDNAEVFDNLFQIYQKGSLPIDVILELFNIDTNEVAEKLKRDMWTVKDSLFNEVLRGAYTGATEDIGKNTDIQELFVKHFTGPGGEKLTYKAPQEEGGDGGGMGGDMGGGAPTGMDAIPEGGDEAPLGQDEGQPAAEGDDSGISVVNPPTVKMPSQEEAPSEKQEEAPSKEEQQTADLKSLEDSLFQPLLNKLPENSTKEDIDKALEKLKI